MKSTLSVWSESSLQVDTSMKGLKGDFATFQSHLHLCVCMCGYRSAFNTIEPVKLVLKLSSLGLNCSLCNWILDFLTGRPQVMRMGSLTSSALTLSTGAPQGCVLSPLLYALYTHDCPATHSSNTILKFTDDDTTRMVVSSSSTMMRPPTRRWSGTWQYDARATTSLSASVRLRR